MTAAPPELVLRSLNGDWNYARWEAFGNDGNRYLKIKGTAMDLARPLVC